MKIGYKGNYNDRVDVYVDGEITGLHFRRTYWGMFQLFNRNVFIDEYKTLEEVYNKVEEGLK